MDLAGNGVTTSPSGGRSQKSVMYACAPHLRELARVEHWIELHMRLLSGISVLLEAVVLSLQREGYQWYWLIWLNV